MCAQHLQLNCIAVTETWLAAVDSFDIVNFEGYSSHSQPRSLSYSSRNPTLIEIQGQQHGGVSIYRANSLAYNIIQPPNVNIECLVYNCISFNIVIAVIYRPPSYPMSSFKENLLKLLDWLTPLSNCAAVTDDGRFQ